MPRYPLVPTPLDNVTTLTSCLQVTLEKNISSLLLSWLDLAEDKMTQLYQPVDSVILSRAKHTSYLYPLLSRLPRGPAKLENSRTWIIYWLVGSLFMLGVKVKEEERLRLIETILSFQHPQGGFGCGPGQPAHLGSTYSAIWTLALLLDEADQTLVDQTWVQVDLRTMYQWLLSIKLPDGSFATSHDAEIDTRGCYGAICLATVFNLLTPELVHNVPKYLIGCQSYEGGLSATSVSYHAQQKGIHTPTHPKSGIPAGEAHGGYTLCALAAFFLVQGSPSLKGSPKFNYGSCLRWAAQMQGSPVEGGGFRGRTNKLVDGCYSWWCGGIFTLLKALMWPDSPDQQKAVDLYDRQALQDYILLISQDLTPKVALGGLRDKPSLRPDLYHTHCVLAGLSTAQHSPKYSSQRVLKLKETFKTPDFSKCVLGNSECESEAIERMKESYSRALGWEFDEDGESVVGLISNRLDPIHPVFNTKISAVEKMMKYFYHQNQV